MLTSLQNPLVKHLRKLHRSKERHSQNVCLLEGTHLLAEACAVGYPLSTVCCTPDWQARHSILWQQLQASVERLELVSPEVLAAIASTVQPDGVVAIAPRRRFDPLPVPVQLGVALETIQDPGNLGTIIRTAAAAGVDGLWVSADSVDIDHPKVLRATAGQWFRLPMGVSPDLACELPRLQRSGVQIIATQPTASTTYWDLDLTPPTLILVGNEGAGLSPTLAAIADHQVAIPQASEVESLNVAIATALLLYEARRQRGGMGHRAWGRGASTGGRPSDSTAQFSNGA